MNRCHKLLAGYLKASRLVGYLGSEEGLSLKWITEVWSLAL
jgi:hypothetical protein